MRKTLLVVMMLGLLAMPTWAASKGTMATLNPRPTGYAEAGAPATESRIDFSAVQEEVGMIRDLVAHFPKGAEAAFKITEVALNGVPQQAFLVRNQSVFNGNRIIHGSEDYSIALYAGWEPKKEYRIALAGLTEAGKTISMSVVAAAPENRAAIAGVSFAKPTADTPYHHITMTLAKESLKAGTVSKVVVDGKQVDGKFSHYVRYYNEGVQDPAAEKTAGLIGENHTAVIDGSRNFRLTAPCAWTNGSKHTMQVTVLHEDGEEATYEKEATAGGKGGYWDADWTKSVSIVLSETVGIPRDGEPVQLTLGVFSDDLTNPAAEVRVVTYDPTRPNAGDDGYVVAPCQIIAASEWRDEAVLNTEERDAETGELVHRYDPTTTLELVFLADVSAYEERVYQVLYGNPNATALAVTTDLKIAQGEALAQTIATDNYQVTLSANSGMVETITVKGEGDPVLLEHKLETNGAVHWNPGCYAPPTPWVHVSDWEAPTMAEITGPLMHRNRRYAPLPHMDTVAANVAYTFYAGEPYVLMSSLMEVKEEIFVKALRNSELVFNHAVLNEFIWVDPLGTVQNMLVEGSKEHPIHALEIPADTPWMALINREAGVGFASITLAYENTNLYGDPPSLAQPYLYVQNGPWIYWSRPLVYPFGGQNLTRLMRVRKGSLYLEKIAWYPFRLSEGNDPFADVKKLAKRLEHPLVVHEWMDMDERSPDKWVMPILTMPFDEGVAGAVSAHKEVTEGGEEQ